MHLLVTNPQEIQAYTIVRSLRPFARRLVVTYGGDSLNPQGFEGMTMHSRFVDARHEVPYFATDWLAGRSGESNTEAEEAYIRRIEEICRLESIDVIFPSLDPEVHVFAKNKRRLQDQGVVVVTPGLDMVRVPLDKALTMQVAQRVGFPCPKTFFPVSTADLDDVVSQSRAPWIVKPRFTAHGVGMARADDEAELRAAYARLSQLHDRVIVQEYVGGSVRQNYYVTVDRSGRVLSLLSPRSTRVSDWGQYRVSTKSAISASTAPGLDRMHALLRELGLWGGYTIQTKVDPRDGIPKLMEINARLGQHVWWRTGLGVNEPLICLQLARGEQPAGDFRFPDGVLLLDPYHDFFKLFDLFVAGAWRALDLVIARVRGEALAPRDEPGFRAEFARYAPDYFNFRPKRFAPEFASLFSDPRACLKAYAFKMRPTMAASRRRIADTLGRRFRRLRRET